ncbi:serine O-acetyltransferase [Fictibacillus fluitans]|uniref:Serine acetyltransferase n=1 Tax=Fictibacillus fluitans TaxID=3058422 RepID=A0ABT8HTP7_9BACL|nr:serine acetyltransferase [Fictibacillus sp. NE201]MDN4524143.1 serine acetyltransferase [Fictibacillus sp. NE201]
MPIKNRDDYKIYLEADLIARKLDRWKYSYRVMHPELYFQRLLRKSEYLKTKKFNSRFSMLRYNLSLRKLKKVGARLGISIHPGSIGPGLKIPHCGSVIVNKKARIGKNCEIHSGVNIGMHKGGVPDIGNNVYIAPGAKLFGGIKIGNNVSIGANSVVTKDVPDNVTVVGIPAKIISENSKSQVRRAYDMVKKSRLHQVAK